MLPLISQLQHQYGMSRPHAGHRRLEALTTANTAPIRFALDFASLYPATAPEYSACFEVGAWYRRGLPSTQTPPASGTATCPTSGSQNDCWARCTADDLITDAGRQVMIDVVTAIAPEVSRLLALRPVSGNLQFDTSRGRYQRAVRDKGWTPAYACASDCTTISQVAVASTYCDAGVEADVVLSVRKPPVISGIAGT